MFFKRGNPFGSSKPCPSVDDFDTSDMEGGSRPRNQGYKRDSPKAQAKQKYNVDMSSRFSKWTGKKVDRIEMNVNGYNVTVNRYGGDDSRLQVLIVGYHDDTNICETVSKSELNKFINSHI